MKFTNKQALNLTLVAGDNTYIAKADSQIRALTVYNPTSDSMDLAIKISGKQYIKKTITTGSTEVINQLFNQQLNKDEPMIITGTGLNVLMTLVEITE